MKTQTPPQKSAFITIENGAYVGKDAKTGAVISRDAVRSYVERRLRSAGYAKIVSYP